VFPNASNDLITPSDDNVVLRYHVVFVPPPEQGEYLVAHYNYQSTDKNPKNAILFCNSQQTSVTKDGSGSVHLHMHHPSGELCTMRIDASEHGVGGPQIETKEEREKALREGKAVSNVIGTRALGTRFNVLMVVQVPLQIPPIRSKDCFGGAKGSWFAQQEAESCEAFGDDKDRGCTLSWKGDVGPRLGRSSAGRVSLGKRTGAFVQKHDHVLTRDLTQPITATVMLYYVVEDGIPREEDIDRAVSELDTLYAAGDGKKIFDAGIYTEAPPIFKDHGVSCFPTSQFRTAGK
jgi:hypothetical protein